MDVSLRKTSLLSLSLMIDALSRKSDHVKIAPAALQKAAKHGEASATRALLARSTRGPRGRIPRT